LDAERAKKEPLLIFKINRKGTWIAHRNLPTEVFKDNHERIFNVDTNLLAMHLRISETETTIFLIEPFDVYFNRLDSEKFK